MQKITAFIECIVINDDLHKFINVYSHNQL